MTLDYRPGPITHANQAQPMTLSLTLKKTTLCFVPNTTRLI